MNVIVILLDSLNFHCLEPYGATHVQTPNLARFARRAAVFDNHFAGSMPCMPARRELFTGRIEFPWRGWGPLEPWDRHLARDAAQQGAVTQMVTDHYHYWENAAHGYFESFDGVEFVRGHEFDMWQTDARPGETPPDWVAAVNRRRPRRARGMDGEGTAYWLNARRWKDESEFPCAQVFRRSADWLQDNRGHEKFLLWIEAFDPHEPHYLPEPYRSLYVESPPPNPNCWPPYQNSEQTQKFLAEASDRELAWIRAQYYGKVTFADRWLGRIWDRMDALDLWKDTAVVLTTDHGHDLCYDRTNLPYPWAKAYPHPESHARIPLMIWHPRHPGNGRRIAALTAAVDINATVREMAGDPNAAGPHGRSLLPLIRGETDAHRDWVLYGDFGTGAVLSTRDWTLAQGRCGRGEHAWYSSTGQRVSREMTCGRFLPGVEIPQWRVPSGIAGAMPSFLWDRSAFSLVPRNRMAERPDKARDMREQLLAAIREVGCPPEWPAWLGLI